MRNSENRPGDVPANDLEPTPEELDLIEKLAGAIVVRRMTVPAILFLETSKPLSFLGSQFLYFFEPIVRALVKGDQYNRFARLMEDRANVERLLRAIEAREADAQEKERLAKAARKAREAEKKARRKKEEQKP
jgi:hypothetical protein